jgi:hypothetical protein
LTDGNFAHFFADPPGVHGACPKPNRVAADVPFLNPGGVSDEDLPCQEMRDFLAVVMPPEALWRAYPNEHRQRAVRALKYPVGTGLRITLDEPIFRERGRVQLR